MVKPMNLDFKQSHPWVSIVMGSKSDHEVMASAAQIFKELEIPYEMSVVSAHRTPQWMFEYAQQAESRGLQVIIAGAGGAAHLPGMLASLTLVPVLGVPIPTTALNGMDALLSIVQMPAGVPVGTLAIGKAGATNAALLAALILARSRPDLAARLQKRRDEKMQNILAEKFLE